MEHSRTSPAHTPCSTNRGAVPGRAELEHLRNELRPVAGELPRIVLIENEYAIAHLETDVAWIAKLLEDLRSGALTWNYDDLIDTARRMDAGGEDQP